MFFAEILPTIEEVEGIVTQILNHETTVERIPSPWFGNEAFREVFKRLLDPTIEQVEETVTYILLEGPLDLETIAERLPGPWFENEAVRDSVGEVFDRLAQEILGGGRFGLQGAHPRPSPDDIRDVLSTFNGRTSANLVEWFGHRLLNADDLLAPLREAAYQDPAVEGSLWYARFPSADGNTEALEQDLAVNQRRRVEARLQANLPAEMPSWPTTSGPTRSSPPPARTPPSTPLSSAPSSPTPPSPGPPANPRTHPPIRPIIYVKVRCDGTNQRGKRCGNRKQVPRGTPYNCGRH